MPDTTTIAGEGLFGLAALHTTPDTLRADEAAIIDDALWHRDGTADPVPVGGSGGGVFATATQYGLLYAALIGYDAGDIATYHETGPLAGTLSWADDSGLVLRADVEGVVPVHAFATMTGGQSPVNALINSASGAYSVQADGPDLSDAGAFYIQIWGTLSA